MWKSLGHTVCVGVCLCYSLVAVTTVNGENRVPNPYRTAKIGDWAKYNVEVECSYAPLKYEVTKEVTSIENDIVKIAKHVVYDDGSTGQFDMEVNRAEPLPLITLLGYDKPHNMRVVKTDSGSESLSVGSRSLPTTWTQYEIGRETLYPGKKSIWIAHGVPLDGVAKLQTIASQSISTSTLVAFGRKGDAKHDPGKEDPKEADIAERQTTTSTDSIGIQLVKIPKGNFEMGAIPHNRFNLLVLEKKSTEAKLELLGLTPPQRWVAIPRDYWIGAHEVTVEQFRKFVTATGYKTDAEKASGGTGLLPSGSFGNALHFSWREYGFPIDDHFPVVNVSWNDAKAFCEWLSKREGETYRLPSEAEWEYACRGKTTTTFSCGNDINDLKEHANVADQSLARVTPGLPWPASFDDGTAYLTPVGGFKPNPFGLYDMHGNALEWCSNEFSFFDPLKDYSPPKPRTVTHVVRGGNWFNEPARAGSACRSGAPPTTAMSLIGFRVVRETTD